MREIRFKIWDKLGKSFFGGEFNWNKLPQMLYPQDFICCQFTGLKDKNGKEIYEGDILKVKSYDGWFDEVGFYYKSVVFYQEETASFVHANRPELGVGTAFVHPRAPYERDYEVIGNIFENPNLLDK